MANKKEELPVGDKKNIKAFLSEEEGEVTKESVQKIGMGVVAAGIALAGVMHTEEAFSLDCEEGTWTQNHGQHSSHGSHGSHGQW